MPATAQQASQQQADPGQADLGQTQAQSGSNTLHVTTRLVVLDVTVTDQQGHLIDNLPKDAFQVYEDKAPQDIRSFEPPQAHTQPVGVAVDSTAELDRQEPSAPVSILVLDEINTSSQDESFTRYWLKKYLDMQADQLQQPTMLIAVSVNRLSVLQDYTTSKTKLLDSLDHHFADYPWRLGSKSFQGEQFAASFASLMQVAEATSGHAGHKNMIWIGRGFPNLNQATVPPDVWDNIQRTIQICANTLRDSRVTLYTIDPAGVIVDPPEPDDDGFYDEDPFGGQVNFNLMAIATGGQAFFGRNDLDNLIGISIGDGANFYTLTYSPTNKDDTAKPFRNIQVRMKDPNLVAITRTGYYSRIEPPPTGTAIFSRHAKPSPISEQTADLLNAANSTMAFDGVHIAVSPNPGVPGSFRIRINAADIDWQPSSSGPSSADITLLVESFDKKGTVLKRTANVITVQSPAKSTDHALSLLTSLPDNPAAVRVRFVVGVRGTGKIGADNYYFTQAHR